MYMVDTGWDHAYVIKKVELIKNFLKSRAFSKVLDVGSSLGIGQRSGNRLEKFLNSNPCLVHLDLNRKLLLTAKNLEPESSYVLADTEALPFRECSFGLVFCVDVLEHLYHPEEALDEWRRVLQVNGHLVISTPNISLSWNKIIARKIFKTNAYDLNPEHVSIYDMRDLHKSLQRRGLHVNSIVGINLVGAGPTRLIVTALRFLLDKISLPTSKKFNKLLAGLGQDYPLISDSVFIHATVQKV